jgi:predicted nucleotidyltransferase
MVSRITEAKKLSKKIAKRYNPEKIILFGSSVIGKDSKESDIDLLIIKNSEKKRPFRVKKIFEAIRGMNRNYPLDAIVYTPVEVQERLSKGDYFIRNVFREGKVLYEQG